VACLIMLAEASSSYSVFAYLGYMVLSFEELGIDEKDVGEYAGWITSVYFFSQFLSSYFWGILSDKIGRRPSLLAGVSFSMITTFVFGFSRTFWMAVVLRGLNGLLNGNVLIVRTYLADITDSSNQAGAFALLGLSFGLGTAIGPMLGVYLSEITEKGTHKDTMGGLLHKFPYLLPNFILGIIMLIILILAWIYLLESKRKGYRSIPEHDVDEKPVVATGKGSYKGEFEVDHPSLKKLKESRWETLKETLRDPNIILVTVLYMLYSFSTSFMMVIFPIWSMLKFEDGGLEFNTSDTGLANAMSGFFTIIFQTFIYRRLISLLGLVWAYRLSQFICAVMVVLAPIGASGTSHLYGTPGEAWFWIVNLSLCAVYVAMIIYGFSALGTIINNTTSNDRLGGVNGLTQTAASLARSASPAIGSAFFAMTLHLNSNYFISYRLSFWVISGIYMVSLLLAFKLPAYLNKPYSERPKTEK